MAVTLGGLAAIAGGAAALNTVGSAVFGNINNKRAKSMAALNDRYQRQLLEDVPSLNKKGLQKAGLSVSALNGNAFNSVSSNAAAAAPEMTAPQVDTGQLLQMATLPDQKKLLKEQVKGVELDNSSKALQNEISQNKARAYGNLISMLEDEDPKVRESALRVFKDINSSNSVENGETVVSAPVVKPKMADYEIYQALSGNKSSQNASEIAGYNASQKRNEVEERIYDSQLLDKKLIFKLAHLDGKRYDQLEYAVKTLKQNYQFNEAVKQYRIDVEKYGSESAKINYEELKRTINNSKGYDWHELINKITGDGDWSWKDVLKVVLAISAASLAKGNGSIQIAPHTTVNSMKLGE